MGKKSLLFCVLGFVCQKGVGIIGQWESTSDWFMNEQDDQNIKSLPIYILSHSPPANSIPHSTQITDFFYSFYESMIILLDLL